MSEDDRWKVAAARIIADLSGRAGLGNAWDDVDAETQAEIAEEWAGILRAAAKMEFAALIAAAYRDAAEVVGKLDEWPASAILDRIPTDAKVALDTMLLEAKKEGKEHALAMWKKSGLAVTADPDLLVQAREEGRREAWGAQAKYIDLAAHVDAARAEGAAKRDKVLDGILSIVINKFVKDAAAEISFTREEGLSNALVAAREEGRAEGFEAGKREPTNERILAIFQNEVPKVKRAARAWKALAKQLHADEIHQVVDRQGQRSRVTVSRSATAVAQARLDEREAIRAVMKTVDDATVRYELGTFVGLASEVIEVIDRRIRARGEKP